LNIDADLYVRFPILGLVKIASIKGPLTEDKNESVKITIVAPIGEGSGVLWIVKNSRIALYLDLEIKLKWLINITLSDLELGYLLCADFICKFLVLSALTRLRCSASKSTCQSYLSVVVSVVSTPPPLRFVAAFYVICPL
jgi:hypothetical protein